jgi:hypothetical protein
MALPTAASASIDAATNKRSSYNPPTNSIQNALLRMRAKTLLYHVLLRTCDVKEIYSLRE